MRERPGVGCAEHNGVQLTALLFCAPPAVFVPSTIMRVFPDGGDMVYYGALSAMVVVRLLALRACACVRG